jgi:hypothetical protein
MHFVEKGINKLAGSEKQETEGKGYLCSFLDRLSYTAIALPFFQYKTPVFFGFASYLLRTTFVSSSVVFGHLAQ